VAAVAVAVAAVAVAAVGMVHADRVVLRLPFLWKALQLVVQSEAIALSPADQSPGPPAMWLAIVASRSATWIRARFERAGARLVTERDTIAHFIHVRIAVMNSFWRTLRDRRNQQVLSWLGGGLVVAATGLWVAFVYFFPPPKSPETKASQPGSVIVGADCSGIAIGGNVTGATIRTGAMTNSDCASKAK
jgi:hypothetical protein